MKCPDIDRLVEAASGPEVDLPLQDHIRSCDRCRREIYILASLPPAFVPATEVPEALVARTLEALPLGGGRDDAPGPRDRFFTWFLGSLTALIAVSVSDSAEATTGALLAFAALVGVGAVWLQGQMPDTPSPG